MICTILCYRDRDPVSRQHITVIFILMTLIEPLRHIHTVNMF
jgi:hypothetical protein